MTEASEIGTEGGWILGFLLQYPSVFELSEFACDEEEIAAVTSAFGNELPAALEELLRLSDGGLLHGPHDTLRVASVEQMLRWAEEGLHDELGTLPFAHIESNRLFVMDSAGRWGAKGALYGVQWGRRTVTGYPVQDVVRLADSLRELFEYAAAGHDAW